MKINIEKFGPINHFTYDLDKDLIVTYGDNNIGKSYAMQIVYLLLKTFIGGLYVTRSYKGMYFMPYGIDVEIPENEIVKIVQEFIVSKKNSNDITEFITNQVYNLLGNALLPSFMNSCSNTFGNFDKTLADNPIISVKNNQFDFKIILNSKKVDGTIKLNSIRLKKSESDFHKSRNYTDHLDIYVVENVQQPVSIIAQQIQKNFILCIQSIRSLYESVYFLPASRSGIYSGMNAFGSIVAELSKNRAYFTKKIEFPGISEPISDYFISLSNIRNKTNEGLAEYYSDIEQNILKGQVTFDKNQNALMYKPHNMDAHFEMTEVSSMVSEISPIVAFLKYILSPQPKRGRKGKSILFIEEPEAHLHPNNQIALIEVFAKLAKSDIKLIMSSHSNYVFNKLNNLVLGKKIDFNVYQPIILVETERGSISKVLEIDELGAEDENFIDVSEKLYYEREEIIQRLNLEE